MNEEEVVSNILDSLPNWALSDFVIVLLIILFAVVLGNVVNRFIYMGYRIIARNVDYQAKQTIIKRFRTRVGFLVSIVVFSITIRYLPVLEAGVKNFLIRSEKVLYGIAVILIGSKIINFIIAYRIRLIRQKNKSRASIAFMPLLRRTFKALLFIFVALILLDSYGIDIAALIAGLGIGGLAVALAGQKTIENLFGGLTLYIDQPVKVGDFCKFGDYVGTIEDIGIRSTRVRTLDRTVVTVPNASFSEMQLENYSERDNIHFYTVLDLRYDTSADQLRYILLELRKLLIKYEMVETDTLKVRFIGFGASALKIEVFSYILTNEWNRFLAVREDLLLRIMDLVLLSGSSFAYPSQTFYMENGEGLDAEKQAMAEAEVEKMRQEGELLMDYWSDNFVDSIKDSIKFISRDHKPSTNMASSDKNLQSKDKGKKIKTDKSKTQGSDDAAEN